MSEDSDLKFIRCPGCRSLVPAIATRCRMCGQLLVAKNEHQDTEEAQSDKKSRIRQKTLSLDEKSVSDYKDSFSSSRESSEDGHSDHGRSSVSKFLETDRANVVSGEEETTSTAQVEEPRTAGNREPFRFGKQNRNEEYYDYEGSRPVQKAKPEEEQKFQEDNFEPSEYDDFVDNDYDSEDDDELDHEQVQTPSILLDSEPEAPRKKRRKRKRKKKHPQNVEAAPVAIEQKYPAEKPQVVQRAIEQAATPVRSEPAKIHEPLVSRHLQPPVPEPVTIRREEEPVYVQQSLVRKEEKPMTMAGSYMNAATDSHKLPKQKLEGRMIGWLVSYRGDFRGAPIEIREGRFFIGGAKLRDTDLVLADDSLSVPHCLVKAEGRDGFVIQDLMSERGTFIKRQGTSNYDLITVPTVVEHGDWLKFGEYEVMACIVPPDGRNQKA